MIRACTHEAREGEGEGLENRNAEKDEGVRLFLSRECCVRVFVRACICIWANFSLCGRPQSFHAHGSPQKLDDAFCTNRHASRSRARAHIDDTPPPVRAFVRAPLFLPLTGYLA